MTAPAEARPAVRGLAHGCRWMIGVFEELIEDLEGRGHWTPDEFAAAMRLYGVRPEPGEIRRHGLAYQVSVYHYGCAPGVTAAFLADWLEPAHRPEGLRDLPEEELLPERGDCAGR